VDPEVELTKGFNKISTMLKLLATLKTKLTAAAYETQHDKKKQGVIVNGVALMAQQSIILLALQKEDPGHPAIMCFII
jgi:hypothetical protein